MAHFNFDAVVVMLCMFHNIVIIHMQVVYTNFIDIKSIFAML